MKKILKLIKWLFILLITGFILLLISIYISSLYSYKESDFNIPKDFFVTKLGDKDPYSEKNGFNELVRFIEGLSHKEDVDRLQDRMEGSKYLNNDIYLGYYDILSKCIFDEVYKKDGKCEEEKNRYINKIVKKYDQSKNVEDKIKQNYKKLKNLVAINKIKYRKINNKEYILQTPEYSGVTGKVIIFSKLIQYSRAIRYVVYRYFEELEYERGINILLEYQGFIDNLMNKYDSNLIGVLVNFTINRINLESLEYFIDNYDLSDELKEKIKLVLENKVNEGLVINGLKWEYKIHKQILKESTLFFDIYRGIIDNKTWKEGYKYRKISEIIKIFFFYSKNESDILLKKYMYDIINNNGNIGNFIVKININNYLGRIIINYNNMNYSKQFKEEEKLHKLRADILEKLK